MKHYYNTGSREPCLICFAFTSEKYICRNIKIASYDYIYYIYIWLLWHSNFDIDETYADNLTSARDLFNEIISEAIKLNWLILNFSFFSFSRLFGMLTGLPISPGEPLSPITVLAGDHSTMPLFELSPSFSIWLPIADSSTYHHKFRHVKTVNCQPCNDL